VATKLCKSCKIEKETALFNKKSSSRDGLQAKCKSCEIEYKRQNKDRINAYNRSTRQGWTIDRKAQEKEYQRLRWQSPAGREARRKANHKRKAIRKQLPHTPYSWEAIIARDGIKCWMCLVDLDEETRTVDHLIALDVDLDLLVDWGLDHPGDVLDNTAPACRSCNSTKGKKLLICAVLRYLTNVRGPNKMSVLPKGRKP
jgi:5-methylcytosine-specific restriction endonuclease McrA